MMKNRINILIIALLPLVFSCSNKEKPKLTNAKLKVVTTTTMITDMAKQIGGDYIELEGLMGAGVDPHLYKATEGDVIKLSNADIIFYNGLHLEGKLVSVFEKMNHKIEKTVALSDCLDKSTLIKSASFEGSYDPHIWFDIGYWKKMSIFFTENLITKDEKNKEVYQENLKNYLKKLNKLEFYIADQLKILDTSKRILVTAHDAFNYFGSMHSFQVVGLQGISTATEAGVKDLQKLSEFIIKNKVKSIFIESSVPRRTIEALQASVQSKGHNVSIGGSLYSDALGNPGTPEGTYIGMYKHNVRTIVNSLH